MALDNERETLRRELEERLYREFLRLVDDGTEEHAKLRAELGFDDPKFVVTEKDWRYFCLGIANHFIGAAQLSMRAELMGADLQRQLNAGEMPGRFPRKGERVVFVRNALGRFEITNAYDVELRWSGSRWVRPGDGVQISNFASIELAAEDATKNGFKVPDHWDLHEKEGKNPGA